MDGLGNRDITEIDNFFQVYEKSKRKKKKTKATLKHLHDFWVSTGWVSISDNGQL